jgi:hypothetical protein
MFGAIDMIGSDRLVESLLDVTIAWKHSTYLPPQRLRPLEGLRISGV